MATVEELRQQTLQSKVLAEQKRVEAEQAQQKLQEQEQEREQETQPQSKSPTIIAFEALYYGEGARYLSGDALKEYERLSNDINAYQQLKYQYKQSASIDPSRLKSYGLSTGERQKKEVITSTAESYQRAGLSEEESYIAASASYQEGKTFTPEEARRIASEVKESGGYYPTPQTTGGGGGVNYLTEQELKNLRQYGRTENVPETTPSFFQKSISYLGTNLFGLPTGQRFSFKEITKAIDQPQTLFGGKPLEPYVVQTPQDIQRSIELEERIVRSKIVPEFIKQNHRERILELKDELERAKRGEVITREVRYGYAPEVTPAQSVQLAKLLKKNKFQALAEFLGEVEESVKERNVLEQNKYLAKIYVKFFKGRKDGVENFRKLLQDLYGRGIYKGVPVEYVPEVQREAPEILKVLGISGGAALTGLTAKQQPPQTLQSQIQQELPQISKQKQEFKELSNVWGGQVIKTTQKTSQTQTAIEKLQQGGVISDKTALKLITGLTTTQAQTQTPRQTQPQRQVPRQTQIPSQIQRQRLLTGLRTTQRFRPPRMRIQTQKEPRFLLPPRPRRTRTQSMSMGGFFDVFVRTRGRDVRIRRTRTEREAFDALFGNLGSTLRAGGFVRSPTGRKVRPRSLPSMFRFGKSDPFRVIERRKYRLDMPSEVSEIMGYPKRKRGKK